jgi:SET domain-containing protein
MKYILSPTEHKGISVFAKKYIPKNTFIGEYYKNFPNEKYTKNIFGSFDRELSRYCNHSFNPNTYVIPSSNNDGYNLYSLYEISIGDEILVDYILMEKLADAPLNTFYKPNFNEIKQTFIIKNLI